MVRNNVYFNIGAVNYIFMRSSYFESRRINPFVYSDYNLPAWLEDLLFIVKPKMILDFGCGYGQMLLALKRSGYSNVVGYEIDFAAIEYLIGNKIEVIDGRICEVSDIDGQYDLIIMSHVLEHFQKEKIIPLLIEIKKKLSANGSLVVVVPNAQSATGCYWAYEDFTHSTLFTSGSLYYVLNQAGFSSLNFLDKRCLSGLSKRLCS